MWVRKRIDIGGSDIATGLIRCLLPAEYDRRAERLEQF